MAEEIQAKLAEKDAQIAALREAFYAAKAFIDCHAAAPDLTSEMCKNYATYQDKAEALSAPPPAVVPLEDVTPLVEAMEIVIPHLPSSAGIAKARHLAVKHGPTSDSYACRRAIESLATFTAKHPL